MLEVLDYLIVYPVQGATKILPYESGKRHGLAPHTKLSPS